MALGDKLKKIKSQIKDQGLDITKKTDLSEKKSSPLNVSFDTNEREFLKKWAKDEGHSMAVIIKKALKEYYIRHEFEHEEIKRKREEKLLKKHKKHSK